MKEFAEFLVKHLVANTDEVFVEETTDEGFIKLTIKVSQADMPMIIGKGGKNIKSVRNLIRAKAIKEGIRVSVELLDDGQQPIGSPQDNQ